MYGKTPPPPSSQGSVPAFQVPEIFGENVKNDRQDCKMRTMGTWWMEHHIWMFVNYEAMAARNEGNYYDVGWVQFLNDHKLEINVWCIYIHINLESGDSAIFRSPRRPDLGGLKGKGAFKMGLEKRQRIPGSATRNISNLPRQRYSCSLLFNTANSRKIQV